MADAMSFYQQLEANSTAWFKDRQSWADFHNNARRIWDDIKVAGLEEEVLTIIRGFLPGGSITGLVQHHIANKPNTEPCEKCAGSGVETWNDWPGVGHGSRPCTACKGTGRVSKLALLAATEEADPAAERDEMPWDNFSDPRD